MVKTTTDFWEQAYSRNIGKMIGICIRYTGDRPLAEDLAHDAFLKAIEKSSGFEGRGSFDGWLRRIVVNHVLQYIRDQRKYVLADESLDAEDIISEENTIISSYPEFSEQELLEAIQALPEHHRLVFNLYVMDNFTHVQIGEALGISAGTSKSHLARARKKLKQLLAEKANKEHKDKKRIPLLVLPFGGSLIDRLYRKRLIEFEVPAARTRLPDLTHAPAINIIRHGISPLSYLGIAASAGVIIVATVVLYNSQRQLPHADKTEITTPAGSEDQTQKLTPDSTDSKGTQPPSAKNNLPVTDTSAATFSKTPVIAKTMNQKHMKNLDSLAAILLVSSSVVFDSAAQSGNNVVSVSNNKQLVTNRSNTVSFGDDENVSDSSGNVKDKHESGTFYSNTLFWSEENNELYFKGKSAVHIGRNNFINDGSASFLGPVYLLFVNGEQIKPGASIKLSDKKYHLTRLTSKEAREKYGDKGINGAVEIKEGE